MDKLLANLNVLYVKLHNYHYNIVGGDFYNTHVMLEKEYDQMHTWIDEVAEQMKKDGQYPMGSLKDYLATTTIKEVESKDYRSTEIFAEIHKDYRELEANIAELLGGQLSVSAEDLLTGMATELATKLWFFEATVK